MERYSQSQLRTVGNKEAFERRLTMWQAWHNTTGLPSARELGLECIGYSCGRFGCNGSLFRDKSTGELFGLASYGSHIYIR